MIRPPVPVGIVTRPPPDSVCCPIEGSPPPASVGNQTVSRSSSALRAGVATPGGT